MSIEPHDDDRAVAAAFASLKAESGAHFPPPPVDDLIMRGPAALRRRRLVSLAAVVGACTAVTAGGFAVAQTLGPLAGGPESTDAGGAVVETSSDEAPSASPYDPASPGMSGGESAASTPSPPAGGLEALVVDGPFEGDWAASCATGVQTADFDSWKITGDTGWSIAGVAEGDADGDGEYDTILALRCDEKIGVAAFTMEEDADEGPVLASFGWVWQPDGEHELTAVTEVEDGVVAIEGLDEAGEAWTARYEWDGEAEAFVLVDDGPTTEPTPDDETSSSPVPSETPTTDAGASASTTSGS
ncbi:hypothetical protein LO763_14315 [Glycomyces sp. A-F 0318]|uniref:hypothetical protein n=1 Tax=Glycomyces amatae TaxID=2881355 RepID=UPI001E34C151|nr:hypothetical protein [Glycomyces amatae]MCD0444790.1 hypothetical protein [Glycomyces amatae]